MTLVMAIVLGVAAPTVATARECHAGHPVPDRHRSAIAKVSTGLEARAHALACQHLQQRDQSVYAWVKPLQRTLGVVMLGAAVLAGLALMRQWRTARRGRAHVYAWVALYCLSGWMLLRISVAVYRGVTLSNVRGPPRWLWYELSPVAFSVQQCTEAAVAIGVLVLAWAVRDLARPPPPPNPLPRRGPRRR